MRSRDSAKRDGPSDLRVRRGAGVARCKQRRCYLRSSPNATIARDNNGLPLGRIAQTSIRGSLLINNALFIVIIAKRH